VNFRPLPENSPNFVRRLFCDVLKNVKRKMQTSPNDYIRLNIDHPSLDSPVWLEFTRSKKLDEQKILQKIHGIRFFSCKVPPREWMYQKETLTPGQGKFQKE
jgi:hypothetical protein